MKALYIGDITVTAKQKVKSKSVTKKNYPIVLENGRIPSDRLNRTIMSIVTKPVYHRGTPFIPIKDFDKYTFTYEVSNYRFSSNLS